VSSFRRRRNARPSQAGCSIGLGARRRFDPARAGPTGGCARRSADPSATENTAARKLAPARTHGVGRGPDRCLAGASPRAGVGKAPHPKAPCRVARNEDGRFLPARTTSAGRQRARRAGRQSRGELPLTARAAPTEREAPNPLKTHSNREACPCSSSKTSRKNANLPGHGQ
jgi:hypothetical protein